MKYPLFMLLGLVAACGDDGNMMTTPDAPPAAQTIAISGVASQRATSGSTPVEGLTVAAYAVSDETTPLAMTTTDADGKFTLMLDTGGTAIDGYLKATGSGFVDTYWYPPKLFGADYADAGLNMLAPQTFDLLANTLCRGNQDTTAKGMIAAEVRDASDTPVEGATISSDPAATGYCYDSGGFPSSTATATDPDGIGYMFNLDGELTVSASKSGSTFMSHMVKVRPGTLTTTLIEP